AVAVIQDGEVIYSQGFGSRNVATGDPFTPQTQFRIGSTTKSMTSLLVAQLVDEGKLSWDTPVTEIYPDFQTSDPELTAQLTLRDLMGMGTGLESDDLVSLDWGLWTEADLFKAIAAQTAVGEFRQHYAYNNEVYASAGYLAALAAGESLTLESYKTLIQSRLFDPLGMSSTIITDDRSQLSDNYSESYGFTLIDSITNADLVLPAPINVVAPAGAVWSSLEDMSRYVITQMNGGVSPDGTRLVSEVNLAITWEAQTVMPNEEPEIENLGYGMGWVSGTYNGLPFRYHDGGWDGYRTMMTIFPDTQTGLIIFCNHLFGDLFNNALMYAFGEMLDGGDPTPILDEFHTVFDENYVSIDAQLGFLPPPEVDPAVVAPLLGDYEQGWTLEQRADNRLWLIRPNWEMVLRPLPGVDIYLVSSGAAIGATAQFAVEGDEVTLTLDLAGEAWTFAKVG
ncbi:MAG: beta-lactamase family protein, partial [Chloroflexi bacterium]|nr:beta-lactamase family protein [Chloroflexota bacterium]